MKGRFPKIHKPMCSLRSKVALVTGGCSGIGAALVRQLSDRGASVVVADSDIDVNRKVTTEQGGTLEMLRLDVSVSSEVDGLFRVIDREYRSLDLVVNCAGIMCYGELSGISAAQWDRVLSVNLRGTIDVSLAAYALMQRKGGGSIVNVASMAAFLSPPLFGPYITAKAGILGFSRALGIESEIHRIHVSVACPGNVRTPMLGAWRQSFLTPSVSPEYAARRILKGVEKRQSIIVFPLNAKLYWYLDRLSPGLLKPLRREILRRARARGPAE